MIATSHVIIGGTVGTAVGIVTKNPAAALIAGIATHLIADMIPHMDSLFEIELIDGKYDRPKWDTKLYAFAIADSLIAFFFTLIVWYKYYHLYFWAPYAWGALGAYLPDIIDNFPLWNAKIQTLPFFKQFHKLHLEVHNLWRFRFPMPRYRILGWMTQIITITIWLVYLLK